MCEKVTVETRTMRYDYEIIDMKSGYTVPREMRSRRREQNIVIVDMGASLCILHTFLLLSTH